MNNEVKIRNSEDTGKIEFLEYRLWGRREFYEGHKGGSNRLWLLGSKPH